MKGRRTEGINGRTESDEKRMKGRMDGQKEGRKEERKEGRKEGGREGGREGRKKEERRTVMICTETFLLTEYFALECSC